VPHRPIDATYTKMGHISQLPRECRIFLIKVGVTPLKGPLGVLQVFYYPEFFPSTLLIYAAGATRFFLFHPLHSDSMHVLVFRTLQCFCVFVVRHFTPCRQR
jgi:hypothetical protein